MRKKEINETFNKPKGYKWMLKNSLCAMKKMAGKEAVEITESSTIFISTPPPPTHTHTHITFPLNSSYPWLV